MKDKISIIEYLNILQKEWVQFFWAYNVFPERYKGKYKELMDDRKKKIVDITRKIMVSNVFDDINTLEAVFDSIFLDGKKPNFLYRNAETSNKIHHFNMVYFYKGNEVTYNEFDYTVESISPDLNNLMLNGAKPKSVDIESVKHNFNFDKFTKWL